jgi:hypothetical protein
MAYIAGPLATITLIAPLVTPIACYGISQSLARGIVGFWALVPAIWLWYEWFHYLKPIVNSKRYEGELELDMVKHEQSVVRAMWAAFVVVTAALYGVLPITKILQDLGT